METILITGVSGLLGWNLAKRLKSSYRIYGTYLDHPVELDSVETLAFDFTNLSKIRRLCETIRPKLIIHTAALSDADYCETHRKDALNLNTFATRDLARLATHLGAKLIFTSSDLIFDGHRGMYSEADPPAPLSYYAKTKHLAELEIMNNCSSYITLRLSLLYGRGSGGKPTFLEAVEQRVKNDSRVRFFVDQYRTPLFIDDCVNAIEKMAGMKKLKGLFHLGGPQRMSRYQFGETFFRVFDFPRHLMAPAFQADSGLAAPRPKDCSLRSDKAMGTLDLAMTPLSESLGQLRRQTPALQAHALQVNKSSSL